MAAMFAVLFYLRFCGGSKCHHDIRLLAQVSGHWRDEDIIAKLLGESHPYKIIALSIQKLKTPMRNTNLLTYRF